MKFIKQMLAVSTGSYSDYRVLAIFDDEATANAWADAVGGSAERIDFVPSGVAPFQSTTYNCCVTFWDDGRIETGNVVADTEWAIAHWDGGPPERPHLRFVRAPCHGGKGGRLDIRAASVEACFKVSGERIAMWKTGAWNTRELREWTNDEAEQD